MAGVGSKMNFDDLPFYMDFLIAILYFAMFIKESDLIKKQLSLYLFSFVVLVVFSQVIFGKQYSGKHDIFTTGLDQVKHIIYLFSLTFFLFSRNLPTTPYLKVNSLKKVLGFDLILGIPILIFLIYYSATKGVRLQGEFVEHAGDRSIWVDYIYVYVIACLISLRGSLVILLLAGFLALAHLLAAERMRAFVYIVSFLIVYHRLHEKKHQASFIFLIGFSLATVVGILRHGSVATNDSYNVTHFGSVTISSLFLLDEANLFTFLQQTKFFVGSIIANIIPSSFLSEEFNIRQFLVNQQDIPGGGWLPVWVYAIGGYIGVFILAYVLASFYRWILYTRNGISLTKHDLAKYAMMVIFISTLPRWFMYTPFQVIKMPLYGYIGTFLLLSFIQAFSKGKKIG
jgi:hypothetical protein